MAIDVIARAGTIPLIVGDEEDMEGFVAVGFDTGDDSDEEEGKGKGGSGDGHPCLFVDRDGDGPVPIRLGKDCATVFAESDSAIIVSISDDDEIVSAYVVPVGSSDVEMRSLEEPELKKLTESIVSKDFAVDFLR